MIFTEIARFLSSLYALKDYRPDCAIVLKDLSVLTAFKKFKWYCMKLMEPL